MRTILVILLMLSLSYQWIAKLGIVAWYEINKDYIASHLCENRDKPWKKCCGKCYLHKQLKKADDNNSKSLPTKTEKAEYALFIIPQKITLQFTPVTDNHHFTATDQRFITFDPLSSIFHPPPVC